MSYADVLDRLGAPCEIETELPPHLHGDVHVVGEMVHAADSARAHVLLTYSQPGGRFAAYPMVWVHLRMRRVSSVYVKRYLAFLDDEEGIYGYSTDRARSGDRARLEAILAP